MMNETEKKVVMEVSAKLLSTAESLAKGGFIGEMDMSRLLAELGGDLSQLFLKKVSLHSSTGEAAEEREHMSRAEAVWILMQLQAVEACCGHANVNAATARAIGCHPIHLTYIMHGKRKPNDTLRRRLARMGITCTVDGTPFGASK